MMNKSDDGDNDVPPLEDMSDLLQQAQQLRQIKEKKRGGAGQGGRGSHPAGSPAEDCSVRKPADEPDQGDHVETKRVQNDSQNIANASYPKPTAKASDSFGGMKKGFLFGAPAKSSKSKASKQTKVDGNRSKRNDDGKTPVDDIPLIKPQATGDGAQHESHKIPEVQEALRASAPFLNNKDWITDDLLAKIDKNPQLLRQMSDPRFSQAMAMFQTDPQGAMKLFQDNPEIQTFFKEFCGIMGDHFSQLGASDSSASSPGQERSPLVRPANDSIRIREESGADMTVASSTDPREPLVADEARMRDIMADPKVQKAFTDPRIAKLFAALRSDPDKAQEMMRTGDAEFKGHIKTLVDKGLLGFAR